jgi:hypothetical protein
MRLLSTAAAVFAGLPSVLGAYDLYKVRTTPWSIVYRDLICSCVIGLGRNSRYTAGARTSK